MDKCPYCGAETRAGDNFCLNCGNRLVSTPSPSASQQSQTEISESSQASPVEWGGSGQDQGVAASSWSGSNSGAATIANSSAEPSTFRAEAPQATMDRIENPARFILRADDGTILQEYPLDKAEISIGRAPNSDILLSKDKLTSRRHAIVRYENGNYVLRDERSANGTFVNGQQIEEMVPRVLQEGDHIGIGEHELLFRSSVSSATDVEDLPTISVPNEQPAQEMTYRTREDAMAATSDEFRTRSMENSSLAEAQQNQEDQQAPAVQPEEAQPDYARSAANGSSMPNAPASVPGIPVANSYTATSASTSSQPVESASAPVANVPVSESAAQSPLSNTPYTAPSSNTGMDTNLTFSRLTSVSQTSLPDMTPLMAALSTLDGQVMSLQEQLNATQDAMRNHDTEVAQTANQLRTGVRRVSERMDNTIADVARSREALAWAELSQLMEDVMNNPRDIEYVTKLARKARELNKIFQIHQNVLNTMYECNSLLRGMIGEDK